MSQLGFHIILGPRNGYGEMLRRCAEAGRPVALVKSVDEGGALLEAKQYSRATVTIYRTRRGRAPDVPAGNFTGDPWAVADRWMDALFPIWRANPADYYEPINEPDPPTVEGYRWLNAFTEQCIALANQQGFKLALYSFAAGVPELYEFAELVPSLQLAKAGGHILSLHEYGLPNLMRDSYPSLATRYRDYYRHACEPRDCVLPLAITEAAPNGGYEWNRFGAQSFVDDVTWYDTELMRDPYVIGAALFTLGQWEAHNANYMDVLPQLAGWMIANPTPPAPEPPPEPPPEPKPPGKRYAVCTDNRQLFQATRAYAEHFKDGLGAKVWAEIVDA